MAINQNHTFEEIEGLRCAIVEKGVTTERGKFLKQLLELNGYTVVMVPTPIPKAAPKPVAATVEEKATGPETSEAPVVPETFILGVTDLTFSPVNAIYGRQLHTQDGHVVTPAYWQQKEAVSHDEIPYYQVKK